MTIYCCGCGCDVDARLTDGREVYPHRCDLYDLPFWMCDDCRNFVGCHYKSKDRTKPLGCIPTPEIKSARRMIHEMLDPIWRKGRMGRGHLYSKISKHLGYEYHTAEVRTAEEAEEILNFIKQL